MYWSPEERTSTAYVKAFESYRVSDRQTDRRIAPVDGVII